MSDLALRGEFVDEELETLRRKLQRAESDIVKLKKSLNDSDLRLLAALSILKAMRKQFEPQYRNLKALFTEFDSAGVSGEISSSDQPIPAEKYTAWKQRLSPACGKVIDALLIQPMTHSQLMGYCKAHYNTILLSLKTLKGNSLIEQNGKIWSLKR